MPYITAVLHPEITFMDRRKSLKILGGTAVGIAGLVLVDWKWQLVDQLTHKGFFSFKEEQLITAIADTIIPAGLPTKVPTPDAQPIEFPVLDGLAHSIAIEKAQPHIGRALEPTLLLL